MLYSTLNSVYVRCKSPSSDASQAAECMKVAEKLNSDSATETMESDLAPRRPNLDDFIYERVKSMLVEGALPPGDRIVPEQLARDMGVSRTPMLSALKRLSQEDLLEWRSGRGVFVRRFSKRELALIFELREVLEGLSARRAATVIEPRQIDHFRSLFAGIDPVESPVSRRAYMRQDYLFHSGLLEIGGSPPLTKTINSVQMMVSAFGAGLLRPISDVMAEHDVIFDALACHDSEAAEAAMRNHIRRSAIWLHHEADLQEQSGAQATQSLFKPGRVKR
jgi:GntR family transcriptional regulator of vanillate catabolism